MMTYVPIDRATIRSAIASADCSCKPGDPTCEDFRDQLHRWDVLTWGVECAIARAIGHTDLPRHPDADREAFVPLTTKLPVSAPHTVPLPPWLEQGPMPLDNVRRPVAALLYDAFGSECPVTDELVRRLIEAVRDGADVRPVACLPRNCCIVDACLTIEGLSNADYLVLRGNPDGTVGIWAR